MARRALIVQFGILALCVIAVTEWASSFPYPSPLIRPLLPPKLRWPAAQIQGWVEAQNFAPGFLEFFARDPERTVPPGHNLVSPADGVVKAIPRKDGIAYFTVGLSFWDVHVVRTPVEGVVKSVTIEGLTLYRNTGETEDQAYLKGRAAPVQAIVAFDTDYGEVKVRLITSYWASRLKVWVHDGDHVRKGDRIGRILLGSSVVAEFQGNVDFDAKPEQRVVGGETIIFSGDKFE